MSTELLAGLLVYVYVERLRAGRIDGNGFKALENEVLRVLMIPMPKERE